MTSNPDGALDKPLFDGVRLQTLEFRTQVESRNKLRDVEIRRTWISSLTNGGYAGNNFNIDRCRIDVAQFKGANDNNTFIQNSKSLLLIPLIVLLSTIGIIIS